MNKRYLCSRHSERTPSVVVYPDHGWCFGCQQKIPLPELGVSPEEAIREASYVENIQATLDYIDSLPKEKVRGFTLPVGPRGYYLVWPDKTYYKLRLKEEDVASKYRGPAGHKKPRFVAHKTGNLRHLILVEGELNALSLAALEPEGDVVSPGAAGDFFSKGRERDLQEYATYARVDLVVDDDGAGLQAAIECSAKLKQLGCQNVKAYFVKRDFNDVLQEGKEALRKYCEELGLLQGL